MPGSEGLHGSLPFPIVFPQTHFPSLALALLRWLPRQTSNKTSKAVSEKVAHFGGSARTARQICKVPLCSRPKACLGVSLPKLFGGGIPYHAPIRSPIHVSHGPPTYLTLKEPLGSRCDAQDPQRKQPPPPGRPSSGSTLRCPGTGRGPHMMPTRALVSINGSGPNPKYVP